MLEFLSIAKHAVRFEKNNSLVKNEERAERAYERAAREMIMDSKGGWDQLSLGFIRTTSAERVALT